MRKLSGNEKIKQFRFSFVLPFPVDAIIIQEINIFKICKIFKAYILRISLVILKNI